MGKEVLTGTGSIWNSRLTYWGMKEEKRTTYRRGWSRRKVNAWWNPDPSGASFDETQLKIAIPVRASAEWQA